MQKFTCKLCLKEKTANEFVKGSKNPTMCLECRRKRMRERKMKRHDSSIQVRKTLTFNSFGLAMIATFQQGGSASDAVNKIFVQAYNNLDEKTREIVHFYEKQFLDKTSVNFQNAPENVNVDD